LGVGNRDKIVPWRVQDGPNFIELDEVLAFDKGGSIGDFSSD